MRSYELLYIVKPDLEAEQVTALTEKFSELVKQHGGEVTQLQPWGKRRLAYEVQKFREGYYVLMQFKGEPSVAQELERVLKISDEILRYLTTRLDEGAS